MRKNLGRLLLLGGTTVLLTSCGAFADGFQSGYHFARGDAYYKSGRDKEAETELKEAMADVDKASTPIWWQKSRCLVRLAQIYVKEGKSTEADAYLKEALDIFGRNEDSSEIKGNRFHLKEFWISALHSRAALLAKEPGHDAEAKDLEAKAMKLESK